MTSANPQANPNDETPVEATGRCPIVLLLAFSLAWLLVSGTLAFIAGVQAHTPAFMAGCPILTYGHTRALQDTAFTYGWIANCGLALVTWILGRLGGHPLRAANWMGVGALFWNIAVAAGMVGIATNSATALTSLQIPGHIQPLMLAAYASIAVAGVLAWCGRSRPSLYAAQWYGVALLFFFPWIFSVAQVMLVWAPVHGVLQAIVEGWYAQSLWTLWMAPIALAGAYYVVPRVTGRVIPGYDLALLGFWSLIFIGGWTGGRHLIGGPVPAWIPTIAIVASVLLLPHYIIVLLNLGGAFTRNPADREGGRSLAFISFGLAAYVLGGAVDSVTGIRSVAAAIQFTWFDEAQRQLAVYGGVTMMLFGTLYYALPRLAGRAWASASLARGHLILSCIGIVLLVVGTAGAGIVQGSDLSTAGVSFAAIATDVHPWLSVGSVAHATLLLGNILLAINFAMTVGCGRLRAAAEALSS